MITKLFKNRYFLAILGIIFILYYIWFRYIRERLPKDIPYNLSNISFVILLYICIIYLYLIFRLIKPKQPNKLILKIMVFYSKLQIIFINLNQVMQNNFYVKNKLEHLILMIVNLLNTSTLYYNNAKKIFYIYFFVTKILLLLSLIADIFIFRQIYYFYFFIIITISSPLLNYLLYSLYVLQSKYEIVLQDYLIEITSEDSETLEYYLDPSTISYDNIMETEFDSQYKYLNVINFVNSQASAIMWEDTPYEYKILHKSERQDSLDWSKCPIKNETIFENEIHSMILYLIKFRIIYQTMKYLGKRKFYRVSYVTLYLFYFICWTYVLITADYSNVLTKFPIIIMKIKDIIEPFSGCFL